MKQTKEEICTAQLTQMIGGCIRNIRKGYWNDHTYGLANKKVDTAEDGLKTVLMRTKGSIFI
jgi:hypothetical protein